MKRRRVVGGLAAAALAPPLRLPAQEGAARVAPLPWADLEPLPPGRRARFTDLGRVTGQVVPNDEFFVLHHGEVPEISRGAFRLSLGRRGETPARTLGPYELAGLPRRESVVLFECCGNGGIGMHGLVGAARWGGVALSPLLEGLTGPDSREVVFFGADRTEERLRGNRYPAQFARSLPLADALAPGALLADSMNGAPLPAEHGGPLRLIVPGFYGVAQVKWVERIEVWPSRFAGWYQAKDYVTVRGVETGAGVVHTASAIGRMRLKSLVTRVEPAGGRDLMIRGLAWNDGATPITGVEVGVDGGALAPAELEPAAHRYGFRRFRRRWAEPAPGEHRLVSRARDGRGLQPTEAEASRYRATPWENNGQVVRRLRL